MLYKKLFVSKSIRMSVRPQTVRKLGVSREKGWLKSGHFGVNLQTNNSTNHFALKSFIVELFKSYRMM